MARMSIETVIKASIMIIVTMILFSYSSNLSDSSKEGISSIELTKLKEKCELSSRFCNFEICEEGYDCSEAEENTWIALKNYAKKCDMDENGCNNLQAQVLDAMEKQILDVGTNIDNLELNNNYRDSFNSIEPEFFDKVETIANKLGTNPEYLVAVMNYETGGTFNPCVKNQAGSGAVGLIQFMPSTAKSLLNTHTEIEAVEELCNMDREEQLDYVYEYYRGYSGNINSFSDAYMIVLCPNAIGREVFTSKDGSIVCDPNKDANAQYSQNEGLDENEDGVITVAEASEKVYTSYQSKFT